MNPRALAPFVIAVLLALAGPARAAEPTASEMATRRLLLEQAEVAAEAQQHDVALEKYLRAGQILMTPSLRFMIAQEQEAVGAVVEALGTAQLCSLEVSGKDIPDRETIQNACAAIEKRLAARVGRVVVELGDRPEGLVVKLGAQVLKPALLGVPVLVTPGRLTLEATAPGHEPYRQEVAVPQGQEVRVPVKLVALPAAPCPPGQRRDAHGACVADPAVAIVQGPVKKEGDDDVRPTRLRDAGLIVGSAGLLVTVAGAISWFISDSEYKALQKSCPACTNSEYESGTEKVRRFDRIAGVTLVGGALLTVTGAVLYFGSGSGEHAEGAGKPGAGRGVRVGVDPLARAVSLHAAF